VGFCHKAAEGGGIFQYWHEEGCIIIRYIINAKLISMVEDLFHAE
jgi:hypothetical protein